MKSLTALMLGLFFLASCTEDGVSKRSKTMGFAPVYGTKADLLASIKMTPPRNLTQPGKIYVYNDLLFVNDANDGVLVIDNADPSNPEKLGFLSIPGNNDIAIRNGYLYADYGLGIVTLDISDINNPVSTSFIERQESDISLVPPDWMIEKFRSEVETQDGRVYFECVDPSKGLVIKWENKELKNPSCYRTFNSWF